MDHDYRLRRAALEDARAIRALSRQAYAKWVPVLGREPLPMAADYDEAVRKHRFDLLYHGGELAGLIETTAQEGHLLIINVAVRPGDQGKGFGRVLIEHAERLAARAGCAEVKLYLSKRFADNLRIYQRLGFRVEREEETALGTVVFMNKSLS